MRKKNIDKGVYMEKLDLILKEGLTRNASDVHLLVGCPPMLRIAKELTPLNNFGIITFEEQQEFVKALANNKEEVLDLLKEEKLLDLNYKYENQRFRVNISFSMDVPTCTLRIIKEQLPRFESLNLPNQVRELTLKSQGLILVTGKPGSGKTTTLSALVDAINESQNKKIMILENPIEYVHHNKRSIIVQKEIGLFGDCKTFHIGVKNALREDCDVLVIGEIRDRETMDAAIEMAETGHLVIGTLHTNSCAETIDRIINFYAVEEQQTVKHMISAIIKLIVSQRMLRGMYGNLVMVPEILIVDEQMSSIIKREKFNNVDIEDAMLTGREKGNCGLVFALADAVTSGKVSLELALNEVDIKNQDMLKKVVAQGRQRQYYN